MRYAILSDIHGNLEALEAVIAECREEGVRKYFCLGDIVGYGANPKECIERIQQIKAVTIAGNHDWAVSGKFDINVFSDNARIVIEWTQAQLETSQLDYLNALPLTHNEPDFVLVHGTLNHPQEFQYLSDLSKSSDTFYLMETALCFVGHTHKVQTFIKPQDGNLMIFDEKVFEVNQSHKYIINVGSVGQPRDGDPNASFCIYDPDLKRIELKRAVYDVQSAQQKILDANLPDLLAKRLMIGQ